MGLDGDSKNTAAAGVFSAISHSSSDVPSMKSVDTPHRGRISSKMMKHEPKRALLATIRSPDSTMAASALNTAAIPEAVAHTASTPSSIRRRSSNAAMVGFP